MIDREGCDANSAAVVDDPVRDFDGTDLCSCRGRAVVGLTDLYIERECLTEVGQHAARAAGAPQGERPGPPWTHEPSRQPQIRKPNNVIRVEMS